MSRGTFSLYISHLCAGRVTHSFAGIKELYYSPISNIWTPSYPSPYRRTNKQDPSLHVVFIIATLVGNHSADTGLCSVSSIIKKPF